MNDYGPEKTAYAKAEVPVHLVVDPFQRRWHLHLHPKGEDHATETKADFGEPVDLTATPVGLTLTTDEFPQD